MATRTMEVTTTIYLYVATTKHVATTITRQL
jgi:hypothetical protein